jgi:hypothetical protein
MLNEYVEELPSRSPLQVVGCDMADAVLGLLDEELPLLLVSSLVF